MEEKMKIITIILAASSLLCSSVFAVGFTPTPMKISAPQHVQYDFDNSQCEIPVTISGTPATAIFTIFTKDKSAAISEVRNGFLGWHYVNNVDTCVFVSLSLSLSKGSSTIRWDGKGDGGSYIPAGDYTYYIWAYDSQSPKTLVTASSLVPNRYATIEEFDQNGKPLTNPFITNWTSKWVIGNDPNDATLVETTNMVLPEGYELYDCICFQPENYNNYFAQVSNGDTGWLGIMKFQWVPNGDAVLATEWGDNGTLQLPASATGGIVGNWYSGVHTDGQYLYATHCSRSSATVNFYVSDISEGTLLKTIDLSNWWASTNDLEHNGQITGGPNCMKERNGLVFLNSHTSCLKSMVNPAAAMENDSEFWVWNNGNGDYVNDHNFASDAANPWVCFDYNVGPYTYTISADANLFSITPSYDMGAVSFALMAPDGTGIGYFAFAGETASIKRGDEFVDTGSAFDGIYTDNNSTGTDDASKAGLWYVAQDSFKGIISSQVDVKSDAPAAFSVSQNSPNPFNPTTTISFTLAKAGRTTVEVYNVAGQKIDTLVNTSLNAGSHSVTWNAAKFSAGVYFYAVKSGSFSKTSKMTLLK